MPSWFITQSTAPSIVPVWWASPNCVTTTSTGPALWYPGTAANIFNITSNITNATGTYTIYTYQDWENIVNAQEYHRLAQARALAYPVRIRERTEAENRRYAEEQQQRAERAAREALARAEAAARAKELLLAHLTPEQRATFERNGWFIVKGGKTGTRYKIETKGYAVNIHTLQNDKPINRLCCHIRHDMPLHDHHVAQMLSLQYDEERFLQTANCHRV